LLMAVVTPEAGFEHWVLEHPVPHLEVPYLGADLDDLSAPLVAPGQTGSLSSPLPSYPRVHVHHVAHPARSDLDDRALRGAPWISNILVPDVTWCIVDSCLHALLLL